jgi:hypothetical protein
MRDEGEIEDGGQTTENRKEARPAAVGGPGTLFP